MSIPMKTVLSALVISVLLASASLAATLFGIDANQGNSRLDRVNETTGAATQIGGTVISTVQSGLAYDSANGTMYVSDASPGPNFIPGLGTVNLSTGAITYIGAFGSTLEIAGLAYDSKNDVLYGADDQCFNLGGLATINLTNGTSTCPAPFTGSNNTVLQIFGLAYDASTDTLYGISQNQLYTIDRGSGLATAAPNPTGQPSASMTSLDIDPDTGVMYAGDYLNNNLYTINKATGAATLVGATGMTEISALASGPNPSVTAIPAASTAGLVLLVLLLAAGALAVLRR